MLLEESLCSPCNAFLLGESHAFRPTTMGAVISESDFRENQRALVHHYQVNFTQTAVKVPLQCFEPAAIQESFSDFFPFTTLRTPVVHGGKCYKPYLPGKLSRAAGRP